MKMDEGLDTGAMAMAERMPIGADMTAGELHDALSRLGADLMPRVLAAAERRSLQLTPQPQSGGHLRGKISNTETRIDWKKSWKQVHDHIRGLSPFPGAWFELGGVRVKALRSTKGDGLGCARHRARRQAHRRLCRWRRAAHAGSALRQAADGRRGISARNAGESRHAGHLKHAALQAHH